MNIMVGYYEIVHMPIPALILSCDVEDCKFFRFYLSPFQLAQKVQTFVN